MHCLNFSPLAFWSSRCLPANTSWQSVALGPVLKDKRISIAQSREEKMSGTLATVFVDDNKTVTCFYDSCQGIAVS
jgi:hypothetical protein